MLSSSEKDKQLTELKQQHTDGLSTSSRLSTQLTSLSKQLSQLRKEFSEQDEKYREEIQQQHSEQFSLQLTATQEQLQTQQEQQQQHSQKQEEQLSALKSQLADKQRRLEQLEATAKQTEATHQLALEEVQTKWKKELELTNEQKNALLLEKNNWMNHNTELKSSSDTHLRDLVFVLLFARFFCSVLLSLLSLFSCFHHLWFLLCLFFSDGIVTTETERARNGCDQNRRIRCANQT
jgi:chromosome segregation ATPase